MQYSLSEAQRRPRNRQTHNEQQRRVERGREREKRIRARRTDSFRFTIQFAAPRNLIKCFYVYYGQFYMYVYPRHIDSRAIGRPSFSIIHPFRPRFSLASGFVCLEKSSRRWTSNEPRKNLESRRILGNFSRKKMIFLRSCLSTFVSGRGERRPCLLRFTSAPFANRMFAFRRFTTGFTGWFTRIASMHTHRCIFSCIFNSIVVSFPHFSLKYRRSLCFWYSEKWASWSELLTTIARNS